MPSSFVYDPDAAPEPERETIGVLEASYLVEGLDVPDAQAAAAVERYRKASGSTGPIWYLRARALDVVRSDGSPFYLSDVLNLTTRDGRPLPRGQAPSLVAQAYLDLGVSASYSKLGTPESAVGKIFRFRTKVLSYGHSGLSKRINCWPVELLPDDFKPETVRTVGVTEHPVGEPAAPDVTEILLEAVDGRKMNELLPAVLGSPQLVSAGTWRGIPLLEGAVNGSLLKALVDADLVYLDGERVVVNR